MVQPGIPPRQAHHGRLEAAQQRHHRPGLQAGQNERPKPPTETEAESAQESERSERDFDSWHPGCPSEPSEVEVGPCPYAGGVG